MMENLSKGSWDNKEVDQQIVSLCQVGAEGGWVTTVVFLIKIL